MKRGEDRIGHRHGRGVFAGIGARAHRGAHAPGFTLLTRIAVVVSVSSASTCMSPRPRTSTRRKRPSKRDRGSTPLVVNTIDASPDARQRHRVCVRMNAALTWTCMTRTHVTTS
jgi:hypothetical protein